MITIGILQCGHAPAALVERHGDYDTMFARLLGDEEFAFRTWAVVDGALPGDIAAADGWLITGSRHAVYEDHPWLAPLEDFLRAAYAAAVPIVGVCFGHQVLAKALGGRVEKFAGGWSVGRTVYARYGHPATRLLAFHQDQVVEIPADATVTGGTPFCPYAFLAYGERAISMQPHPEFSDAYVQDLVSARAEVLPAEQVAAAREQAGAPLDTVAVAEDIRAFYRRALATSARAGADSAAR
ncbi:MAG: type 1 glutamine amidotransferase [Gammaproteobacteria bacterium]